MPCRALQELLLFPPVAKQVMVSCCVLGLSFFPMAGDLEYVILYLRFVYLICLFIYLFMQIHCTGFGYIMGLVPIGWPGCLGNEGGVEIMRTVEFLGRFLEQCSLTSACCLVVWVSGSHLCNSHRDRPTRVSSVGMGKEKERRNVVERERFASWLACRYKMQIR